MKIEFDQSPAAVRAFRVFDGWEAPEKKSFRVRTRLTGAIIMFVLPLIIFSMTAESFDLSVFLNLLLFSALLFLLGFAASRHTILNRIETRTEKFLHDETNSDATGDHELVLEDGKVMWKTVSSNGTFPLSDIDKLYSNDEYYFLYFKNMPAWSIPKSVMGSRERAEFEGLLKSYIR